MFRAAENDPFCKSTIQKFLNFSGELSTLESFPALIEYGEKNSRASFFDPRLHFVGRIQYDVFDIREFRSKFQIS